MNTSLKQVFISALILLLLTCAGITAVSGTTGAFLVAGMASRKEATLSPQPVPSGFLPLADSAENLPADIQSQMDEIEAQVGQIRGLYPGGSFQRDVLSKQELSRYMSEEMNETYSPEEAQDDVRVMALMGLAPPDYPLYEVLLDLYNEQVAGFYEAESDEMYVVQGQGFSAMERMTYAHEYTHTLQDQAYDLEEGLKINSKYCRDHTEYCAAVTALVEGDASLTEQLWYFRHTGTEDQQQLNEFFTAYQSPILDSVPEYLRRDLFFPYVAGMEFVCTLYDTGGFAAVDAAYLNPPVSTEQIMHPQDYPDDLPQKLILPEFPLAEEQGWYLLEQSTLGEWYSLMLLAYGHDAAFRLPLEQARAAAAGWGGDAYAVYWNATSAQGALILRSDWESLQDAREFWSALSNYGDLRWGENASPAPNQIFWENTGEGSNAAALLHRQSTLWIIAPDQALLKEILSVFPDFQEK